MSSSHTPEYHKASNAVDGVTVCLSGHSLAHTLAEYRPWIKIDLQATYDVYSVVIYNREDCCGKCMQFFIYQYFCAVFESVFIASRTPGEGEKLQTNKAKCKQSFKEKYA